MKLIESSHVILSPKGAEGFLEAAHLIEYAGRLAYKSESIITANSYDPFIRKIISRGHESVLEHGVMAVKIINDRGVSHEEVRHRLAAYTQESTRYVNYSTDKNDGQCSFIKIDWEHAGFEEFKFLEAEWIDAMKDAERHYLTMIRLGATPQYARSVLPNSTKTELVWTANFREWRHIFKLRAISKMAHPQIREVMIPLYEECRKFLPCIFEMGSPE
jgi:thymidylate synthase (FAD)